MNNELLEGEVITIADGVTIEKFNDDVFFINVAGVGVRSLRHDDEVVLFEVFNRLHVEATRE